MSVNLKQMQLSGFEPNLDLEWQKIGDTLAPPGADANNYEDKSFADIVAIDTCRILVIEQLYGNNRESLVRVFDARTREWSDEKWPSLNQSRECFGLVFCNGKVYVIGGLSSDEVSLNSIECLDPSASCRQWVTLDHRLTTDRFESMVCSAAGTQVIILGGMNEEGEMTSVEMLNTETGQLVRGPDLPLCQSITAASVDSVLMVFAIGIVEDIEIDSNELHVMPGEHDSSVHLMRYGQPNSRWEMNSFKMLTDYSFFKEPLVIGNCVVFSSDCVYDTKQECSWCLPSVPSNAPFDGFFDWTVVNGTEIIAFTCTSIYSLKLELIAKPPEDAVLGLNRRQN